MTTLARIAPDTLQLTPGIALDADGALSLRPTLESLAMAGAPRVVLDLSRVERMDGSGIGAIAFLRKRLLAAGQAMEVVGAHGQPLALLRSLGLAAVFGLEEARRPFWSGLFRPLPGTGWGAEGVTRTAFLLPLLLLGACAQWPEQGGGGLAEIRPAAPAAPDDLAQRLACALARMDALEQAAARSGQGTGQAALLRVIATRATREAHGSLPRDANRTLDRLGADAALLHPVVGRPVLPECT